jgi:signal peptidase I
MQFDFPTFLVLASGLTGLIWAIDAINFALRAKRRNRKESMLVEYARSFFPVIFAVLILRSFLIEPFRIPSGSMMPTLLIGDFILVNKYTYGLRLPVINQKIIEMGTPQRGDVIVFRYPNDPTVDYIKRVIGVPGDRIAYSNKTLYVNGEQAQLVPLGIYNGVGSGARETGASHAMENLAGVKHAILMHPYTPALTTNCHFLPNGPVPAGHYFVMGDNRDNSNDSRCWGLVPDANLVGKAVAVWMNWDWGSESIIAWQRIGNLIH